MPPAQRELEAGADRQDRRQPDPIDWQAYEPPEAGVHRPPLGFSRTGDLADLAECSTTGRRFFPDLGTGRQVSADPGTDPRSAAAAPQPCSRPRRACWNAGDRRRRIGTRPRAVIRLLAGELRSGRTTSRSTADDDRAEVRAVLHSPTPADGAQPRAAAMPRWPTFVAPKENRPKADWIGGFAVTSGDRARRAGGGVRGARNDDYNSILAKALSESAGRSLRRADARAGCARSSGAMRPTSICTNQQLIAEGIQGHPPGPGGYPACPRTIRRSRRCSRCWTRRTPPESPLTESMAMTRGSAVQRPLLQPPAVDVLRPRQDRPRPGRGLYAVSQRALITGGGSSAGWGRTSTTSPARPRRKRRRRRRRKGCGPRAWFHVAIQDRWSFPRRWGSQRTPRVAAAVPVPRRCPPAPRG